MVRTTYRSWDEFFTRRSQPGIRSFAAPTDDSVVISVAETTPFGIQREIQLHDTFWAKGQRHSLAHLLGVNFDDLTRSEKGQEIGRLHFHGSTHCSVFGPNVNLDIQKNALPGNEKPVPVLSKLATVLPEGWLGVVDLEARWTCRNQDSDFKGSLIVNRVLA